MHNPYPGFFQHATTYEALKPTEVIVCNVTKQLAFTRLSKNAFVIAIVAEKINCNDKKLRNIVRKIRHIELRDCWYTKLEIARCFEILIIVSWLS